MTAGMTTQTTAIECSLERLRAFGERVYEHAGLSPADARTVVDVQLEADLRGVDTHGFQRLPGMSNGRSKGRTAPGRGSRLSPGDSLTSTGALRPTRRRRCRASFPPLAATRARG